MGADLSSKHTLSCGLWTRLREDRQLLRGWAPPEGGRPRTSFSPCAWSGLQISLSKRWRQGLKRVQPGSAPSPLTLVL